MSTANTAPTAYQSIRTQRTILGHPAGLFVLFFTEMWERFSYYGMRGLLRAYMVYYLFSTANRPLYPRGDALLLPTYIARLREALK